MDPPSASFKSITLGAPTNPNAALSFPANSSITVLDFLTLVNQATLTLGGGSVLNITTLTLSGNSTVVCRSKNTTAQVNGQWAGVGVAIYAGNLTIEAGSKISADGQGYVGGQTAGSPGQGPGGGIWTNGDWRAAGGSYGGKGGWSINGGTPGNTYGYAVQPTDLGSGGSADDHNQDWGGSGGGAIRLVVSGTLTNNGLISANGTGGGYPAGAGGSGGSIWVTTGALTGSGTFQANGGNRVHDYGAGGGGGRIAVYYASDAGFTGFSASTANPGSSRNPATTGTVAFFDTSIPNNHLKIFQYLYFDADSAIRFGAITLANGAQLDLGGGTVLTVDGAFTLSGNSTVVCQSKNTTAQVNGQWAGVGVAIYAGNLTIEAGSKISADGQGYVGGQTAGSPGQGPGGGIWTNGDWRAAGGSYGGKGGWSINGGTPGNTYGYAVQPTDLGSGGSADDHNQDWGGSGGGAIRLVVSGTLTNNGLISANGTGGGYPAGAGGSGGSIWVTTGALTGSGTFQANGGNRVHDYGAGGGGGRIAVYYASDAGFTGFSASTANPGSSRNPATTGTVGFFIKSAANPAGYALVFDGQDDFIKTTPTNIPNNLPLTIEAWVKPELRSDASDFPANVISNHWTGKGGIGFGVNVWTGGSMLTIDSHGPETRTVLGLFAADNWYHIALVYTEGNVKTYVDGMLVDDYNFTQTTPDGLSYLTIGRFSSDSLAGTARFFKGTIDEVRLWSTALSEEDILRGMDRSFPPNQPNLAAYWQFDEAVGGIAFDQTNADVRGLLGDGATAAQPTRAPSGSMISGADLIVSAASANVSQIKIGDTLTVNWTGKNRGFGAAFASWSDAVFLSTDNKYDLTDFFLIGAARLDSSPLAKDATYVLSKTFAMPPVPAGNYYLVFLTDRWDEQSETDDSNNTRAVPIEVQSGAQPDLTVITPRAPPSANWGQNIEVAWTVKNIGAAPALAAWFDTVFLSADQLLDASDVVLGSANSAEFLPLDINQTYQFVRSFVIPIHLAAGKHYLLFVTDAYGALPEGSEANNLVTVPIALPGPDLVPTTPIAPTSVSIGQTLDLFWTVNNIGPGSALGAWIDRVYLSTDGVLDADDILLGTQDQTIRSPLAPLDGAYQGTVRVTIPFATPPGTHYLIFVTDSAATQPETDETNNLIVKPVQVLAPNLVVTQITATPQASWGQKISITFTVTNQGPGDALNTWNDRIFLSATSTLDGSSVALLDINASSRSPLAAGATYTVTVDVTIPCPSFNADVKLLVVTDNYGNQPEVDDADNIAHRPIQIVGPDLRVAQVVPSVTTVSRGQLINLAWTVANQGQGAAFFAWSDTVYLSTDQTLSSDDRLLVSAPAALVPMIAGANYQTARDIIIPALTPGSYYLIVATDQANAQAETNDQNNTNAVAINVVDRTGPRLIAYQPIGSVNHDVATVRVTFNEAIAGGTFTGADVLLLTPAGQVNNALITVYQVDSTTFDIAFPNQTADGAYLFTLGPDITDLAGNRLAGVAYFTDFEAGADGNWSNTTTATATALTRFLGEFSNHTNTFSLSNLAAHSGIEIVWDLFIIDSWDAGSDYFGFSVSGRPASEFNYSFSVFNWASQSYPGRPDEVGDFYNRGWNENVYRNVGYAFPHAGEGLQVSFYGRNLEGVDNEGWGLDNFRVYLTSAAGGTQTGIFTIERAGPAVIGMTPSNIVSDPINSIDLTFSEPVAAASFGIDDIAFVGPTGNTISVNPPIWVGGNTYRLVFPAQTAAGTYTLRIGPGVTDLAGNEMDQNRDGANGQPTVDVFVGQIIVRLPDLKVTTITAPSNANWQDTIAVNWTVKNIGDGSANAKWSDAIYLSADQILNAGDTLLLSESISSQSPLAVAATYVLTRNVTIPAGRATGAQYLLVITDRENQQVDANRSNNTLALPISIAAPDLVVTGLTWQPTPVRDGQLLTFSASIKNDGIGAITREFYVRFEIDGAFVGRQLFNAGLAEGASAVVTQTWIPLPGVHTVRAVVDEYNVVGEINENNNDRSVALPAIADETAPVINSITPPTSARLRGIVQLSIAATDNVGVTAYAFEWSTDGALWHLIADGPASQVAWDTAAIPGGTYQLRGSARDAAGHVGYKTVAYTLDSVPPTPSALTATTTEMSIRLSWTDSNAPDFAYYRLFRSITPGTAYQAINGALTQTTFVDNAVEVGRIYYYVVATFDQVGNQSAFSNEVYAAPAADSTPPVVTAFNPADGARSATTIGLTASATDNVAVLRYAFEYSADGASWQQIASGASTASWNVTSIPSGQYHVRVTAFDAVGNNASITRKYVVDHIAPATPANMRLTTGQVALVAAWDSVIADDFRHYNLYRQIPGGSMILLASTTSTVYVDNSVATGNTYTYRVTAVDSLGNESSPSADVSASPGNDTTPPVVRTLIPADNSKTNNSLLISTTATDNVLVKSFLFEYCPAGQNAWTTIGQDSNPGRGGSTWSGQIVWSTTGLAEGQYTVRVTAIDHGDNTATLQRTYIVDRSSPQAIAAPLVQNNRRGARLDISWNPSAESDAAQYGVYRSTSPGAGYARIALTPQLTYADTGLQNGTTYYYTITVFDSAGNESTPSAEASGTPTAESDLGVVSLSFSPASPVRGREGSIVVRVENSGPSNATARLIVEDTTGIGTSLLNQVITVNSGTVLDVTVPWTPTTAGVRSIRARVSEVAPEDVDASNNVHAQDVAVNIAPVANAGPDKTGNWNTPIEFTGSLSTDEDGLVVAYAWDFGDGETAPRGTITHTYKLPGVYTATLTATDNRGTASQDTVTVTVADTRADLVVSKLEWNPVEPQERDRVTITATLANIGNGPTLFGFFVTFYIDGQYQGYKRFNDLLQKGGAGQVSFDWTATKGMHTLKVVADDIQDNIVEIDESNNSAKTAMSLQQVYFPDLAITNLSCPIQGPRITSEQPLLATATVKNNGAADAIDFWVSLYLDGVQVSRKHVNQLIVGAQQEITFQFAPVAGNHTLVAIADDPVSLVVEANEDNNSATLVLPTVALDYPDLTVSNITLLPRETILSDGTSIDMAATIRNLGSVAAERRFLVSFYADDRFVGNREITYLAAGAEITVALQTLATPGVHSVRVVVDQDSRIAEAREDNNVANTQTADLVIMYPDLVVSNISWVPQSLKYGQTISFMVTVSDTTVVSTLDNCLFTLYVDGEPVAKQALPRITGHSSQSFTLAVPATFKPNQPHVVTGVIDSANAIREEDETNNSMVQSQSLSIADTFVMTLTTPGAAAANDDDTTGQGPVLYTTTQVAEIVVNVRRGSDLMVSMTPQLGVESYITCVKEGAWYIDDQGNAKQRPDEVIFDHTPMTFSVADWSYHASVNLIQFGTGNYTFRVTSTDGIDSATEIKQAIVIEELNFSLQTDKPVYKRGDMIQITGRVLTIGGDPVALQKIMLMVTQGDTDFAMFDLTRSFFNESTRMFTTMTDEEGYIDFAFQSAWGDAGSYSVDAFAKGRLAGTAGHTGFNILSMDLDPRRLTVDWVKNSSYSRILTLKNLGDMPLHGLQVSFTDNNPDDNVTAQLVGVVPNVLGGGVAIPLTIKVTIPENAPDSATFTLRVTSTEGVNAITNIGLILRNPTPQPTLDQTDLKVGVNPGSSFSQTLTLTNNGMGTMRDIQLVAPSLLPWVTLAGLGKSELKPGESTTFQIKVAPPVGVTLGLYVDGVIVTDGLRSASLRLTVEVSSADRGSLAFLLNNDAGQFVPNAEITLVSHESFMAVSASGQQTTYHNIYHLKSNPAGIAVIDDIPLGDYDYTISAAGQETVRGVATVQPRSDARILAITMVAVPLSFKWTVTPIIIEDTYDITLNLSYAVDVPKPQFTFLPPWVCIPHTVAVDMHDQIIIVNPSLIAIHDVTVNVIGANGITLSSLGMIGDMPAKSSTVMALHVAPGNYAFLNGNNTYLLVTGTYITFDPITNLPNPEETTVSGKIPLVNPDPKQTVKVNFGNEKFELNMPNMEEGDGEMMDKFELPRFPEGGGDGTVRELVKIEIKQKATLEREGFDARLELTNGISSPLVGLTISPRVTDEYGFDVTERFYIVPPVLENISALDGSDQLGAFATLNAKWILIPGDSLGGTDLAGKKYYVKAVLSYYADGRLKETQTNSVEIVVHPQPKLYFHYYVPQNVLADEPFKLGLLVENEGDGVATNLKIDSGQPKIVENLAGLLIDFRIIGSSFGSQTGDIVRLVLGDVQPHSTAHGYWIMTCTLDGSFVEFTASITHRAYKGIDINPLILGVFTEIIQHDYLFADARDPNNSFSLIDRDRDGFPDYLINFYTGLHLPIITPESVTVTKQPTPQDRTMNLTVPPLAGYVSVTLPDPMPGSNLRSITRHNADGTTTSLSGNNFWVADGNIHFVDELGYVDDDGYKQPLAGNYTLDFRSALSVVEVNVAPCEFDIIPGGQDFMDGNDNIKINPLPEGSSIQTYELIEPIFYINVDPTEGAKTAVGITIRNEGVVAESGIADIIDVGPDGSETILTSLEIEQLKGLHIKRFVFKFVAANPGKHTIIVRMRNDAPTKERQVAIRVNARPFADAGADFFSTVKEPTKFDGSRTVDSDGFIRWYMWDFGDGTWSNGPGPTHVYTHSGTYKVHLVVKDDTGAMSEDVMQVTINETRPDLTIGQITCNPTTPQEGQTATVTATIRNIGVSATHQGSFHVAFYIDGVYQGFKKVTQAVAPGSSVDVSFLWVATTGNHLFTFTADDLGSMVDEADESNNTKTLALYPDQVYFPDLIVSDIGLSIPQNQPTPWGTPVNIIATIQNVGTADASPFRVDFYVDGQYIGFTTVGGLPDNPGANIVQTTLQWTPSPGEHTITVRADHPLSHVVESDEYNNWAAQTFPALNIVLPNIVVSSFQMWPANGSVQDGQPLIAYGTVRNASTIPVPGKFTVALLAGNEVVGIADVDGIAPGAEKSVRIVWTGSPGTHTLKLVADHASLVPETAEDDNTSTLTPYTVTIAKPDLLPTDISVTGALRFGADVRVAVKIANLGTGYTDQPFNVRLLVNGELAYVQRITRSLSAGSFEYWFVDWRVSSPDPTQCVLTAVVDPNGEINELNENNNTFNKQLGLQPGYELAVTGAAGTFLTTQAIPLALTVKETGTGVFVTPDDGASASLTLYNAANAAVWTASYVYNQAAKAFVVTIPAGALPAGSYQAVTTVTASGLTQKTSVSLTVAADFTTTITTDRAMYHIGQSILISGTVKRASTPLADVPVSIFITHAGTVRKFDVLTAANGTYGYTFTPPASEAGNYQIRASASTGNLTREAAASVTIEGLTVNPPVMDFQMSANSGQINTLTITNVGTATQTNVSVRIEIVSASPAITLILDPAGVPASLSPGQTGTFTIAFNVEDYVGPATFRFVVTSQYAGQTFQTTVSASLQTTPALPAYKLSTPEVQVGVLAGQIIEQVVTITNSGHADLTGLTLVGPSLPFVQLVASSQTVLAPGQSTNLLLRFLPNPEASSATYADQLTLTSNAGNLVIPIVAEIAHHYQPMGSVLLTLLDNFGQAIRNATVILKLQSTIWTDSVSPEIVEQMQQLVLTTNDQGIASFTDVLAGDYNYLITKPAQKTVAGTVRVTPGVQTAVNAKSTVDPFSLSLTSTMSTEPTTLGQIEIGLVMGLSPISKLMTDRPGAEYLILRNEPWLSRRLSFLRLDGARPFMENTSVAINNIGSTELRNVLIAATGDIANYITPRQTYIGNIAAHSSVIFSYDLNVNPDNLPQGDHLIEGALQIMTATGSDQIEFPIRIRIADSENTHNGQPYLYVPYSGPWPTGPVMYGQDFVTKWFAYANLAGSRATGHDLASAQLSQDVILDGQSVTYTFALSNTMTDAHLVITNARIVITDSTGNNVSDKFTVSLVTSPVTTLPPGQSIDGVWQIMPKRGNGLGGTDPAGQNYSVSLYVDYSINGRLGQETIGPENMTVMPEPQFIIRYEVERNYLNDENAVGLRAVVSNAGPGLANRLELGMPRITVNGKYTVDDPASRVITNLGPNQTDYALWVLRFDTAPDIAAIVSSLDASTLRFSGADPGITFQAPVVQQFFGTRSVNDIRSALQNLLTVSKTMIENELHTLAQAYKDIHSLMREGVSLIHMDMASQLFNVFCNILFDSISLIKSTTSLAKNIADRIASGNYLEDIKGLKEGMTDFGEKLDTFTGDLMGVFDAAITAQAAEKDLKIIFHQLGDLLNDSRATVNDFYALVASNTAYYRVKTYLLADMLTGGEMTDQQIRDLLDQIITKGGPSIGGIADLEKELDDIVRNTNNLLETAKITAAFPAELLYQELVDMTYAISRMSRGIGASEELRNTLQPHWYAVGEPGNWLPVFQQTWKLGSVYDAWVHTQKMVAMQYSNFAFHYDILARLFLITGIANMNKALSDLTGPMGSGFWSFANALTTDITKLYQDALASMRQAERTTNLILVKDTAKFLLAHQYDAAGVWRLFWDFQNHIAYIIEHNPLDPDVLLNVESICFPDTLIPDDGDLAYAPGEIALTNRSPFPINVTASVAVIAGGSVLGNYDTSTISLEPNKSGVARIGIVLPDASMVDVAGYDLQVYLNAYDPVTLSRKIFGPYYTHLFVGSQNNMNRFHEQSASQPLGGTVGSEQEFQRFINISPTAGEVRVVLMHGDDADLDLHLFDPAGRHVGFSTLLNADETLIPNAHFSGSNAQYQVISFRNVAAGQYRLVVTVNSAAPDSLFAVYLREIPVYPALLAASAESIDLITNLDAGQSNQINFNLSAIEWGTFTNVTNLHVAISPLTSSTGATLPVTSASFTNAPSLAAGSNETISGTLLLDAAALDGKYSAYLTITGRDAATNALLTISIPFTVQIDRVAPAIPAITLSPIPAALPVTLSGLTEPNALVEIYLDDHYLADLYADDTGHFTASSIVLAMGPHTFTARATDAAGNVSSFCAAVPVTSTVDPYAPITTPTFTGTQQADGSFSSNVLVSLAAADEPNGSGVKSTEYSVNGGPWINYAAPFTISTEGLTRILFRSTDNAGNREFDRVKYVQIAKAVTPPVVAIGADLVLPQGAQFTRSGSFSDTGSHASWTATVDYGDGAGPRPLTLNPDKTFTLNKAYTPGTFAITVSVNDDLGATGSTTIILTFLPGQRSGTAANDSFTIRQDPTGLYTQFFENTPTSASPTFFIRTTLLTSAIDYNTQAGNDTFTIDFSNGNPLPAAGLVLNGNEGSDYLRIIGTTAPDAFTISSSILTINGISLNFAAFEQIAIDAGAGDDSITITAALPFTPTINAGPGHNALNISAGAYRYNSDLGASSSNLSLNLSNAASIQFASSQHLASLTLSNSSLASFTPGANKVLVTGNLQLSPTATLDLADNDLILHATPASRNAALAKIASLIRTAQSNNWHGPGIASSSASTTPLAGLAAILNSVAGRPLFTQFHQQDVGDNDILVRYTWIGDANLDGLINADDYFLIDSSFITKPANPGYYDGDFTYDGLINADDYFYIDSAYIGQSGNAADHLYISSGNYVFDSDPINGRPNLNLHLSGNASVTFSTSIHLASLSIADSARLTLAGAATVLRTSSLSIAQQATLDLDRGSLVLQTTPSNRFQILNTVRSMIKSGYGNPANPWLGSGITSTAARSNSHTGLSAILNDFGGSAGPVLTSFAGELVNVNSVIVKYTWTGDANLDGRVNADDYFAIDSGYILHATTYQSGDFNVDGFINADDYFLIDSAFVAQTGIL